MRILIFNVKFSENLGDGILAMCLERGLMRAREDIEVETVDVAGRQAFGEVREGRRFLLRLLELMPTSLRRLAVSAALARSLPRWSGFWRQRVDQADVAVIGGGNLFQDDDLNFPLKIGTVLGILRGAGLPVAVHAVGASRHWSLRARELFAGLLGNRVVHVSVRDEGSRQNWRGYFGETFDVEICPDPGLLAAEMLGIQPVPPLDREPTVGICVTHPVILRRHAGISFSQVPLRSVSAYRDLARDLARRGYKVLLFTNGAREDQSFLDKVMQDPASAELIASGHLQAAPRPREPAELLAILQPLSAIVAHRLHASIVAYSFRIPHVGLGWDSKVKSFFKAVGRDRFLVEGDHRPPEIAASVAAAIAEGIDPALHAHQLEQARQGIDRLLDNLSVAFAGPLSRLPSKVS
ncbi:polysaccharide pyruvyl transferase family protein [Pseudaminobacter arsenicus]|uniref:Polysaccharide pyruvyl transferase family protein n=1 Tax=Borborobacter arsenicus TaxID=1851146 RepID=A0A432VBK4_9HYPH|nr:polysaccharide pyruvyl transferase family protein [Pseudaminobacter arsenicus]RUM99559.1 polysaccharide pyruvyl transferase family protein [Pseudaminobacter arsenicus]